MVTYNKADLTPAQMLEEAGLDWRVEKRPIFYQNGADQFISTGRQQALVRSSDNKVLSLVTDTWNPYQNEDAFAFFNDFVAAGEMTMEAAGEYHGGKLVFAQAKIGDTFELPGGDVIDNYFLFVNPHQFGKTIDIRMVPTRLACGNQIAMILRSASKMAFKFNHRKVLDTNEVKLAMGIASERLLKYKEQAEFLTTKRYNNEDVVEYFKRIFPISSEKTDEMSRNATRAVELLDSQPGHEMSEGTWWSAFNSITYITNHEQGRIEDNRKSSLWFGANQERNLTALDKALDYANA